jgi:hypothetical protein
MGCDSATCQLQNELRYDEIIVFIISQSILNHFGHSIAHSDQKTCGYTDKGPPRYRYRYTKKYLGVTHKVHYFWPGRIGEDASFLRCKLLILFSPEKYFLTCLGSLSQQLVVLLPESRRKGA